MRRIRIVNAWKHDASGLEAGLLLTNAVLRHQTDPLLRAGGENTMSADEAHS